MEVILEVLADLFYIVAENMANVTCIGPAYQPEEPTALEELKRNK